MTAAARVKTFWERWEPTIIKTVLGLVVTGFISAASFGWALQGRVISVEVRTQSMEKHLERIDETAELVQRIAGKLGVR